jgi:transcriptional regulator with XRE-family HTH domain
VPRPSQVRKALGQAVQEIRADRGLTQEELADRSSLHRTYIAGIEGGLRNPTIEVLIRLAAGLGCSPSELFKQIETQLGK